MYSKTAAILMLLGFCSGASNLEISSTGTLENHADEISVANADHLVAQASTSLEFFGIPPANIVADCKVPFFGGVFIIALVSFAIYAFTNQTLKTNLKTNAKWMGITLLVHCVLLGVSTGFAFGLQWDTPRNKIVLFICFGVSTAMLLFWIIYFIKGSDFLKKWGDIWHQVTR